MIDYLSQVSPRSRQSARVTLSPLLTTPPLLTVISPGIQLSEETPTVTIIKMRNLSIITIIKHYQHYLLSSVRYTLIVICWTVGRYSLQCVTVVGRWELCEHNTQVFSVDTRPLKGCPTKYVIRLSYILLHCPLLRYADISHALLNQNTQPMNVTYIWSISSSAFSTFSNLHSLWHSIQYMSIQLTLFKVGI